MAKIRYEEYGWGFEPQCTNTMRPNTTEYGLAGNCDACVTPVSKTYRYDASGAVPNTTELLGADFRVLPSGDTITTNPGTIAARQTEVQNWLAQTFGGQWAVSLLGTGTSFDSMTVTGTGVPVSGLASIEVTNIGSSNSLPFTETEE